MARTMTNDVGNRNNEVVRLTFEQPFANHTGGHLAFGPDGYLYIGMGDGGSGGEDASEVLAEAKQLLDETSGFSVQLATEELPDGGVVVRVAATGMCRSDWHAWAGHDDDITALPHVPGHELAGVVA